MKRCAALAEMLKLPKPEDFCTLNCLGFFDEIKLIARASQVFGWVFEMPPGSTEGTAPYSLFEIMGKTSRPSLTHRAELASKLESCLMHFHAVNWLHKAFRSDNIIMIKCQGVMESRICFEFERKDDHVIRARRVVGTRFGHGLGSLGLGKLPE